MLLSYCKYRRIHLFFLALVVSALVPTSHCLPLPGQARKLGGSSRDGLIMGKDFLSLFIGQPEEDRSASSASASVEEEKEVARVEEVAAPTKDQDVTTSSTTTEAAAETTTTSSAPQVQEEVTEPPTKVISVRVSSTSSVSEATPVVKTTTPDIFTTFLDAFSKNSKDVTLVTDNDAQITPSSVQRSDLSIEEASSSSGPIARSIPAYGSKIISNRYRPRSGIYSRSRPRQYSPPQSASEPIEVRLSPTATYSVVRNGRNQVRPQNLPPPQRPPAPNFDITPKSFQSSRVNYEIQTTKQSEPRSLNYQAPQQQYGQSEKVYGQPEKVYGQPEKVYGEPEKVYSQPEKNYGTPEKNYGTPERNYGTPERNYGTPEQTYGTPEQTYGTPERSFVQVPPPPPQNYAQPEQSYGQPEQNYEVPESVNVESRGRVHGVQSPPSSSASPEGLQVFDKDLDAQRAAAANQKFGYVVEGHNYRKYRVEERTPDGFIVGEYGVVNRNDGMLRGVRYTADGTINPKLIYEALMKFLAL